MGENNYHDFVDRVRRKYLFDQTRLTIHQQATFDLNERLLIYLLAEEDTEGQAEYTTLVDCLARIIGSYTGNIKK